MSHHSTNRDGSHRPRHHRRDNEHEKDVKYEYGKKEDIKKETVVKEKEKPSMALSGNLTKDTNTYNGVVIKYNEPSEARKPKKRWRLYCFKGETELPFYPMHRQSAYLFGRDRLVADIPVEHPSCSKQHAVFQYRLVEYKRKDGSTGRIVKPYIIDLGSTNGTFVNNKQVEAQRYFELKEKDIIKFGFSTREYVLLHEESKGDDLSDLDYEEESGAEEDNETKLDDKKNDEASSTHVVKTEIKEEKLSPPSKSTSSKSSSAHKHKKSSSHRRRESSSSSSSRSRSRSSSSDRGDHSKKKKKRRS